MKTISFTKKAGKHLLYVVPKEVKHSKFGSLLRRGIPIKVTLSA